MSKTKILTAALSAVFVGLSGTFAIAFAATSPVFNYYGGTTSSSGERSVTLQAFDPAQTQINYRVNLYDSACNSKIATVKEGIVESRQNQVQHISYNLDQNYPGIGKLSAGNYCEMICVVLKQNAFAQACAVAGFGYNTSSTTNLTFTASPTDFIQLKPGDSWQYQFKVSDSAAKFKKLSGPDFLTIGESGSAVIQSANPEGRYSVLVYASSVQGTATKVFDIVVSKDSNFVSGPAESAVSSEIVFLAPRGNTVFVPNTENQIKWVVGDNDGISKLVFSAINDQAEEFTIKTIEGLNTTLHQDGFDWDVSAVRTGRYRIKLTVTDAKGNVSSKVSDEASVLGTVVSGPVSLPLEGPIILNLSPGEDSTVNIRKPIVSGSFAPGSGKKVLVDSVSVRMDSTDITASCQISEIKFECGLANELSNGKHELQVVVRDNAGGLTRKSWSFSVNDAAVNLNGEASTATNGPVVLVLLLCCITLLLLGVPWILYLLWRRRETDDDQPDNSGEIINNPYSDLTPVYQPAPIVSPIVPVQEIRPEPVIVSAPEPVIVSQPVETAKAPEVVAEQPRNMSFVTPVLPPATEPAPTVPADREDPSIPDWLKAKPAEDTQLNSATKIGSFGYGQKQS